MRLDSPRSKNRSEHKLPVIYWPTRSKVSTPPKILRRIGAYQMRYPNSGPVFLSPISNHRPSSSKLCLCLQRHMQQGRALQVLTNVYPTYQSFHYEDLCLFDTLDLEECHPNTAIVHA
jgi:hypothetical protein